MLIQRPCTSTHDRDRPISSIDAPEPTGARSVYSSHSMPRNQSFQVLVAVLIALGMHICCCQAVPFSLSSGCSEADDTSSVHAESSCCHHDCEPEVQDGDSPAEPENAPHSCCGVHAQPQLSQTTTFDIPPLSCVGLLTAPVRFNTELAAARLPAARASLAAPPPLSSLMRLHCALIV